MADFSQFMKNPQAAKLMGNPSKLEQLKSAPETQKIMALLSQSTGGNLEQAAGEAASGDARQLTDAIRQLMHNPEGARLIQKLKDQMR